MTGAPTGLSLSGTAIFGVPTAAGNWTITVQVTDSGGLTAQHQYPVRIFLSSPFVITTTSLPNATELDAYSAAVAASGGTAPLVWSVSSGSLPSGLLLSSSSGAITGTLQPMTAGIYNFTVKAADSITRTASMNFSMRVWAGNLQITSSSLPVAYLGVAYHFTAAATGGTPPYAWNSTGLPSGLSLASGTGQISGIPGNSTAATTNVTLFVADSGASKANITLPLEFFKVQITTGSLPDATENISYSQQLSAAGGTAPYNWTVSGLPAGLSLSGQNITGTPPIGSFGNYSLSLLATDSTGNSSPYVALPLVVDPGTLQISTSALSNAYLNQLYSFIL